MNPGPYRPSRPFIPPFSCATEPRDSTLAWSRSMRKITLVLFAVAFVVAGSAAMTIYAVRHYTLAQLNLGQQIRDELVYMRKFDRISPDVAAIDTVGKLNARSISQYRALRGKAIDFIWDGNPVPKNIIPQVLASDLPSDHALAAFQPVMLRHTMSSEVVSQMYAFFPFGLEADCALIMLGGHSQGARTIRPDTLNALLAALSAGCIAVHISMPLQGDNYLLEADGSRSQGSHDRFRGRETSGYSPIRYFVEPVAVAVNWLRTNGTSGHIVTAGLSGGGWTAAVAAALDPRIDVTVSIAGSMPLEIRRGRPESDLGDWEQHESKLWDFLTYQDIYILSALEDHRSAHYVWNKEDICCFAGIRAHAFFPDLAGAADRMGISGLTYYVDETPELGHTIGPLGIRSIMTAFAREAPLSVNIACD